MNVKYDAILKPQFIAFNDFIKSVELSITVKPKGIISSFVNKYPTYKTNVTFKAVRVDKEVQLSSSVNMGIIKSFKESEIIAAYHENKNFVLVVPVSEDKKVTINVPYYYLNWLFNLESEEDTDSNQQLEINNHDFVLTLAEKNTTEFEDLNVVYYQPTTPVADLMKASY